MGSARLQLSGRALFRLTCLCVFSLSVLQASAAGAGSMILCRDEVGAGRRRELAEQLRAITGWPGLRFDGDGALRTGDAPPEGGSAKARELLTSARTGRNLIVIEDASGRDDVVFGRVVEARPKGAGPPAFVVQVDFSDFSQVVGDAEALAAFNAGWVALHEISHVTHDAADAARPGEAGECEALVNLMRRECGLAVRAEYHFHLFPGHDGGEFRTRFVRLAFEREHPATNKKRRLYLMWDAASVGGLRNNLDRR
jgi:hypothetical protein